MNIPADRLERWSTRVFEHCGMEASAAATVARVLVWADLRGTGTHGVMRLPRYVEFIRKGDLNPRPAMALRNESPGGALLEADRAAGPVAMLHAANIAGERARHAGIGLCIVRGTTHTGALGFYTHALAEAGMAGIAIAASGPVMAYHGARTAGVSTAPLAIAVPGEDAPIALDMASGAISFGAILQARRLGGALPPDAAIDGKGNTTTDPQAAVLPLPLGGPKGSGLALLIECLTSLIAGNPLLAEALEGTSAGKRHRQNGAIFAIDIARYIELGEFRREAARLARAIGALPPQPGTSVLMPGERGALSAARLAHEGIALPRPVYEELRTLAQTLNLEGP